MFISEEVAISSQQAVYFPPFFFFFPSISLVSAACLWPCVWLKFLQRQTEDTLGISCVMMSAPWSHVGLLRITLWKTGDDTRSPLWFGITKTEISGATMHSLNWWLPHIGTQDLTGGEVGGRDDDVRETRLNYKTTVTVHLRSASVLSWEAFLSSAGPFMCGRSCMHIHTLLICSLGCHARVSQCSRWWGDGRALLSVSGIKISPCAFMLYSHHIRLQQSCRDSLVQR